MDVTRILTIVIQTVMAIIFIYLAILVLKRDKKRLNIIFSMFYIWAFLGTVFNWIYAFLDPALFYYLVLYLNFLTNFFYFGGIGFLLVFNMIVLKSEKIFGTSKQLLYLIVYLGGFGAAMLILINIPSMGVNFLKAGSSSPYWTLPFFLVVILFLTLLSIGPSIYILFQTSKQFTDPELKRKYRYFSIGFIEISAFAYIISFNNYVKNFNTSFSTIALLLGTILVLTGAYLMYIGVGKQISE